MRILIAEDDAALAGFVRQGLQAEHYTVDVAEDGEQARTMGSEIEYDLVILDLGLPRLDGVAGFASLAAAKAEPAGSGADVAKPRRRSGAVSRHRSRRLSSEAIFFHGIIRAHPLLRRSHLPSESVLVVEDLKLDRVERRAERTGRRIELTSKEFSLLEYLRRNAGRQVYRAMIIEHVRNLTFDTITNVVDVYINYVSPQVDQRKVGKLALAIQVAF
jgi:DNA-binding response OmpR family regulator